jgi:hypothetical protein
MWNVEQDGPANERGQYHIEADRADVKRVRDALKGLSSALRHAMGVEVDG